MNTGKRGKMKKESKVEKQEKTKGEWERRRGEPKEKKRGMKNERINEIMDE